MKKCTKCDNERSGKTYCKVCASYWGAAKRYKTTFEHIRYLRESAVECEACTLPFKSSKHKHIDHCHDTGVIRGVLCANCNIALGNAKDNIQILKNLIKYLEKQHYAKYDIT